MTRRGAGKGELRLAQPVFPAIHVGLVRCALPLVPFAFPVNRVVSVECVLLLVRFAFLTNLAVLVEPGLPGTGEAVE